MSYSVRSPQHRAHPSISHPMPALEPSASTARPVSPPTSPRPKPKIRRPSVSSPMSWLARASSSGSTHSTAPYAPSRPVRISEPRFKDPIEAIAHPRSGVLGAGAVVVRTPQDALAGPRASASSPDLLNHSRSTSPHRPIPKEYEDRTDYARPGSPPLPPIPDDRSEFAGEDADAMTLDWQSTSMSVRSHPPPPSRPPPSLPSIPDFDSEVAQARPVSPLRPSPKNMPPPSTSDYFAPTPAPSAPAGVPATPPQSPFDAILMSPVPNSTLDPSKIIVSVETSTETHRTTMATLVSRPSHLASYLLGLFPANDADTRSVYSTNSEVDSSFNSIFHHHLASSGVLTSASTNLHVFLDRPSGPYAHILAYLRSPHSTPDAPAPAPPPLPHAARLNGTTARFDALVDLRDEAAYLGLTELKTLCADELRHHCHPPHRGGAHAHAPGGLGLGLHMRGFSNASSHSARSLHTLREGVEPAEGEGKGEGGDRRSDDSGFASGETGTRRSGSSTSELDVLDAPWPSPPGFKGRGTLKERSPGREAGYASAKAQARPTGDWI
ncbi:hypothetical protein C8Q78DRAFT_960170 [Trametes maxima]|nr:hypothetical protein C8Q78DRAFT_960170 [Trametes maxima]